MGRNTEFLRPLDTGITRPIDELGRVVLPIELRRTLDIHEKDLLSIRIDGDEIILRKQKTACVFCGSQNDLITWKDKPVCRDCAEGITEEMV